MKLSGGSMDGENPSKVINLGRWTQEHPWCSFQRHWRGSGYPCFYSTGHAVMDKIIELDFEGRNHWDFTGTGRKLKGFYWDC
mgnify:CR=1 FL=1